MLIASFPPVVNAIRIRKFIRRFENAGATSPENAKTLQSQGLHCCRVFNRLIRNKVFMEAGSGRYYLVKENYQRFRMIRRTRAVAVLAGLLVFSVIATYIASQFA